MPLPIGTKRSSEISEIQYKKFNMYSGEEIRIRTYSIADIENYLKRIGKRDDSMVVEKATFDLLKSCVHPDDVKVLESLDKPNYIYLVVLLRLHSVSDTIPYPHECPECKTANLEYKIDILPNIKVKYTKEKEIRFSEDLSIQLQNIPYSKELELTRIIDQEDLFNRYELYYHIRSIQIKDEIYPISQFTVDEFYEWLDCEEDESHLSNSQYLQLLTKLREFDDKISIEKTDFCIACGHEINMSVDNFSFFIVQ